MNRKRLLLILLALVALGLGAYWYYVRSHGGMNATPLASPSSNPAATVGTSATGGPSSGDSNRDAPILNATISIPLDSEPPKPDARPTDPILPFEVTSDGYAVAFGDILLGRPPADYADRHGHYDAPKPRLWPTAEIPYLIDPALENPSRVEQALEYLRSHTPILPVPATAAHSDWIVFQPGVERCLSPLGQQGGGQPILLSSGCGVQEILHEILHSLGFVHEQSRWDRDDFVTVLWDQIQPEFHDQFAMVPESFMDTVRGAPFDYQSVMLYRNDAFAKTKGQETLRSKSATPIQRVAEGLSLEDRRRLFRLYKPGETP